MRTLKSLEIPVGAVQYENTETIILKKEIGGVELYADYEETPEIQVMRDKLTLINSLIEKSIIELGIPKEQLRELQKKMVSEKGYAMDITQKRLVRIFNEDFENGGRFYHGWWMEIPNKQERLRRYLKINGNPTVELDYQTFHPTLLYALEGLDAPEDPYLVLGKPLRKSVKHMLNAVINARTRTIKEPNWYKEENTGFTWKALQEMVESEKAYEPIKKYFYTGHGLKLQKLDSTIAEYIVWELAKQGITCLPIHDSFIVEQDYEEKLEGLMRAAVFKLGGVRIITIKRVASDFQNEQAAKEITFEDKNSELIDNDSMSSPVPINSPASIEELFLS